MNNLQKYQQKYRQSHKKENKKYRQEHKGKIDEHRRKQSLKSNYGMTQEQYNKLLIQQNGVCAICLQSEIKKTSSGAVWMLGVDHNHETGKVRGLLCSGCNQGIGFLKDDLTRLELAKQYLLKFNKAIE